MTKRTALRIAALAGIGALALAAAFAWWKWAPRQTPEGQPPLATLHTASLGSFRDTFNAGSGEIRVVALLSPT